MDKVFEAQKLATKTALKMSDELGISFEEAIDKLFEGKDDDAMKIINVDLTDLRSIVDPDYETAHDRAMKKIAENPSLKYEDIIFGILQDVTDGQ